MKIFISYRRDDSAGHAGRLFDHLAPRFGAENIFMDIATIQPGDDFRTTIRNAVGACDVVLVMIGKQWLSITDSQGQRRLDNSTDWVRAEIASALANPRVRVIPVLIRGAGMPGNHELPDDLKDLSWRNASELSDKRFQYDANALIDVIERNTTGIRRRSSLVRYWGIIPALVILGLLAWMLKGILPQTQSATATPTNTPEATSTLPFTDVPVTATEAISIVENTLSPAVQVMDQYYTYINQAAIEDDLSRAWDLLTTKLQCNPTDQCNVENFKNYWWQLQVSYKLYDCESNTVTVELIFYSRGASPNPARQPEYVTYELVNENGQLKLNSGATGNGISAYCKLVVTPAPEIMGVQIRKTGEAPNQVLFADVNFRDTDGDAALIKYELVSTSVATGLRYEDDQITTLATRQISGATLSIQWDCAGQDYTATFNIIIFDKAGNQSNKYPVTFQC